MNNFNGLDKESAKIIISKCSVSTQALSEVVDIVAKNISEEKNKIFRRSIYDVFLIINESVIDPIYNLHPDLRD